MAKGNTSKSKPLSCAAAPCKSCPYRRDVPSGVWAASEYNKLPAYDDPSMWNDGMYLFDCHQQDGKLCAGWVATVNRGNPLALRLASVVGNVDPMVWDYVSPVPLFKSGAAACKHGLRAIERPASRARKMVDQLMRKRRRQNASQERTGR